MYVNYTDLRYIMLWLFYERLMLFFANVVSDVVTVFYFSGVWSVGSSYKSYNFLAERGARAWRSDIKMLENRLRCVSYARSLYTAALSLSARQIKRLVRRRAAVINS